MIRSASLTTLPSRYNLPPTYNAFLYAPIGEDKNGTPLTVLSVLARCNVDPWEEAADLSRLPWESAIRKLSSMIAALPGQSATLADPTEVAGRLLALLPARVASVGSSDDASVATRTLSLSPAVAILLFLAFYMAMMFFGEWMSAG
jgi:hypothetical protein